MSRGDPRHLTDLRRRLEESLSRGAPGSRAQLDMAPSPRPGWTPGLVPESARAAAALALIYEDSKGESSLVLTVRSASNWAPLRLSQ